MHEGRPRQCAHEAGIEVTNAAVAARRPEGRPLTRFFAHPRYLGSPAVSLPHPRHADRRHLGSIRASSQTPAHSGGPPHLRSRSHPHRRRPGGLTARPLAEPAVDPRPVALTRQTEAKLGGETRERETPPHPTHKRGRKAGTAHEGPSSPPSQKNFAGSLPTLAENTGHPLTDTGRAARKLAESAQAGQGSRGRDRAGRNQTAATGPHISGRASRRRQRRPPHTPRPHFPGLHRCSVGGPERRAA